jgi:hypothetical protein
MSECPDCTKAAQVEHWGCTEGCTGCCARSLARIFLRRGERGQRYKRALAQFDLTDDEVKAAHDADAFAKVARP